LWNFIDGTSARLASTRLQQLRVHFPKVLAVIGRDHAFCIIHETHGGWIFKSTRDLRIANGTNALFVDHLLGLEHRHILPNLNKHAAANKIVTTKNSDLEIPIWIDFGNGLAREN
jgi:hypothetical protein